MRADFFEFIEKNCKNEKTFELTYMKLNGNLCKAVGKLYDEIAGLPVKGTAIRWKMMDLWKVFQYFDVNDKTYRSVRLELIIDVKINDVLYTL